MNNHEEAKNNPYTTSCYPPTNSFCPNGMDMFYN